jgi:glycerol-3-phosphate acyltransferase PlsX
MLTIALDAMGGDRGADIVVPAAVAAVKKHENIRLILVGQEELLRKKLRRRGKYHPRISIQNATEVVGMDEHPANALRGKKDSSMRVAINLVKEGKAQACVSAGNTGALYATARFVLKSLPCIDRPAILGMLPAKNKEGYVRILDLGANIKVSGDHLFQFAVMGSVIAKAMDDIEKPRVALLNIGEEDIKGHEEIREAATILNEHPDINYIGFVEGHDIFSNKADVIVCDGFVGNIALKSVEGLASHIRGLIYEALKHNLLTRVLSVFAAPVFAYVRKWSNPANYNGANFAGLNGNVVKSHGSTSAKGFVRAIERAIRVAQYDVPKLIGEEVARQLGDERVNNAADADTEEATA